MSNTVAQTTNVQYSSTATPAKQFASNCTAGSTLVCILTNDKIGAPPSITGVADDVNGAWTSAVNVVNGGSGAAIFYFANNASSGKPTVTGTLSATSYGYLQIFELTGVPTSSVLDASGSENEFITTTTPSIALTCGANSSIIVGWCGYSNVAAADSGYSTAFGPTAIQNNYSFGEYIADAGASGTKTVNMNGAAAPSTQQAFVAAAFKTSGGGGGGGGPIVGGGSLVHGSLVNGGRLVA